MKSNCSLNTKQNGPHIVTEITNCLFYRNNKILDQVNYLKNIEKEKAFINTIRRNIVCTSQLIQNKKHQLYQ